MTKRTLGGSKKLVFTPKKPINPTTSTPLPPTHPTTPSIPSNQSTHNKKRYKQSTDQPTFTPLPTSTPKTLSNLVTHSTHPTEELEFKAENDPLLLNHIETKTVDFGDDVMFLFNGEIDEGSFVVDENGKCYFKKDYKLHDVVPKESEEMIVVYMSDSVYEIGCVYNGFVVCRNDL